MYITRREALAAVVAAASSRTLATLGQNAEPGPPAKQEPDTQFAPPPVPPTDAELKLIEEARKAAQFATVSELVQDPRFMSLHPQPAFRAIVKTAAKQSVISISRDDEPGIRIIAKGRLMDKAGVPVSGALAYVYHTSSEGWYAANAAHFRANSGDQKHARLFGYLVTATDGSFEIRTIRPGGYPRSDLPQHIHFEVEAKGFQPLTTELLFEDDPRLTAEQLERAKREGFIIAAGVPGEVGTLTFNYIVTICPA